MSLRTQSSLDVSEEALQEISSEANKLVFEYLTTISERPVRAENYAGKTTESIAAELSTEGLPLSQLLDECRKIMDLSRHNGHARFFGYVASLPLLSTRTSPAGVPARQAPKSSEWSCAGLDR